MTGIKVAARHGWPALRRCARGPARRLPRRAASPFGRRTPSWPPSQGPNRPWWHEIAPRRGSADAWSRPVCASRRRPRPAARNAESASSCVTFSRAMCSRVSSSTSPIRTVVSCPAVWLISTITCPAFRWCRMGTMQPTRPSGRAPSAGLLPGAGRGRGGAPARGAAAGRDRPMNSTSGRSPGSTAPEATSSSSRPASPARARTAAASEPEGRAADAHYAASSTGAVRSRPCGWGRRWAAAAPG